MDSHDTNEDGTDLDPRIQIELEKLNSATDAINSLEVELDEANTTFRMLLNECTRRLKLLSKRLGSCIEKARPYYEALEVAKQAQRECQKAAVQYQRANEIHQAAKETVALAEQRFLSKQHEWQFDNAWQEMLNHATIKVMEAENAKTESGLEHARRAALFNRATQKLAILETKLSRAIYKSRPYFEEKELCQEQLATQKQRIEALQTEVASVKRAYARSLKSLEAISEEIHARRREKREPGVGAENDVIVAMDRQKSPSSPLSSLSPSRQPSSSSSPQKRRSFSPLLLNQDVAASSSRDINELLDYETELDRCDLQSVGSAASASAPTSSAVSDVEDDSELELELQKIYSKKEWPLSSATITDAGSIASSWEKQVSETISRLGTMLNLKSNFNSFNSNIMNKDKDCPNVTNTSSSCCGDTREKY